MADADGLVVGQPGGVARLQVRSDLLGELAEPVGQLEDRRLEPVGALPVRAGVGQTDLPQLAGQAGEVVGARPGHRVDDHAARAAELFRAYAARGPAGDGVGRLLYLDAKTYLPGDILTKVDRMSMAVSLEARSPFLDHHVIEFAASLPENLKLRGLTTKYLLKRVLKRLLPAENLKRGKMGFPVPIGNWFRREFRHVVDEYVLSERAAARGIF